MSSPAVEVAPARFNRWWYDWLDPAAPAAGSALSVTVEGAWYMRVLSATATVACDANAANRFVSLDYINARGITYARNAPGLVLTANQSAIAFWWDYQRTAGEWAANTPIFAPCLDTWLPPGFMVKVAIDNIQAGDAITAVHLFVMKAATGIEGGPENAFAQLPGV